LKFKLEELEERWVNVTLKGPWWWSSGQHSLSPSTPMIQVLNQLAPKLYEKDENKLKNAGIGLSLKKVTPKILHA
jgi:hypothetical protein